MSFNDSFSYKCDDYISNDTDELTIDKIRKSIMQFRNVETNTDIDQIESTSKSNEEQNSHITNELATNEESTLSLSGDAPSEASSCDIPSNLTIIPESSESKSSKINKVKYFFLV